MRECDVHYARPIKTNSAVNLSRMPGLDLCCDLLQHLQVVRTSILLVPSLELSLFHIKCNQIQFSHYMDGSFCSILFYSVYH